jgi:hypothetical protein
MTEPSSDNSDDKLFDCAVYALRGAGHRIIVAVDSFGLHRVDHNLALTSEQVIGMAVRNKLVTAEGEKL